MSSGSKQYVKMKNNSSDHFQTDPVALDPLLPFLYGEGLVVWEPACGKGLLVEYLNREGIRTFGTDIMHDDGRGTDFLKESIYSDRCDAIITNPPYSLKDEFLARCYEIGKPFALLLPLTTFDSRKRRLLFAEYGVEVVFLPKRIDFETPNGKGSSSWFATAWFTWGFNIGRQLTFTDQP